MVESTPSILGKYELVSLIGKGGMAKVYEGYDPRLDRQIAIKVLHLGPTPPTDFIRRFGREAKAVAKLRHPNIVQVYDYEIMDDMHYLVMELIDGPTLGRTMRRRFAQKKQFTFSEVISIFDQLADAVEYAHRMGIIHRDLKPTNIMFRSDGQVVLTDFGIARLTGVPDLTKKGAVIGTLDYMSPEQCQGETIDKRSDIYSLGIILYEILTGSLPFIAEQPAGLLYKHIHEPPPPLRKINPKIPEAVEKVVLKSLLKKPGQRYQSVLEMAEDFHNALGTTWNRRVTTPLPFSSTPPPVSPELDTLPSFIHPALEYSAQEVEKVSIVTYEKPGVFEKPGKLFGRNKLMAELRPMLEQHQNLLLHGMAGSGKTAIAATISDSLLKEGGHSLIWVSVGKENSSAVLEALVDELSESQLEKQQIRLATGNRKLKLVRDMLGRHSADLVVLDDVWEGEVLKVLRVLPADTAVIVTSRHRLPRLRIIDVDDLMPDDAVDLLGYHAGQKNFRRDPYAADLCKMLGNHPFALEIAGNNLLVDNQSPRQMLMAIRNAPHEMRMPAGADLEERESVGVLLERSYGLLPDSEKTTFLSFGKLFAPSITLELLCRFAQCEQPTIEPALRNLIRRGLVKSRTYKEANIEVFSVHDLTLHFARGKLGQVGDMDDESRFSAVLDHLVTHTQDYDLLEKDMANILGAANAAEKRNSEMLVQLMSWLCFGGYPSPQYSSYLDKRGHTLPILRQLDKAIQASGRLGLDEPKHYLLSKRGNTHQGRGELSDGLNVYKSALAVAPNNFRKIVLMAEIGKVSGLMGKIEAASEYLQASKDLANEVKDDRALGYVLEVQSFWAAQQKDFKATKRYATESVELARKLGDKRTLGFSLLNLGSAERDLGNVSQALTIHKITLALSLNEKLMVLEAFALQALGEDYCRLDQLDKSAKYFNKAINLHQQTGSIENIGYIKNYCRENGVVLQED